MPKYSPSISIRLPEEALNLIHRARQLDSIDESLSAFMSAAASTQADEILEKYRRLEATNQAFTRVPVFPDFVGPFPSGGEKRMVHVTLADGRKEKFRKVATMLNQNVTQFMVLSSVLRAIQVLHAAESTDSSAA